MRYHIYICQLPGKGDGNEVVASWRPGRGVRPCAVTLQLRRITCICMPLYCLCFLYWNTARNMVS